MCSFELQYFELPVPQPEQKKTHDVCDDELVLQVKV